MSKEVIPYGYHDNESLKNLEFQRMLDKIPPAFQNTAEHLYASGSSQGPLLDNFMAAQASQ
tara:strand:- start:96 stop:278 length:183 start_codon:yes stop_codon:yes gene_type:complete